jgi:hypothetical protein
VCVLPAVCLVQVNLSTCNRGKWIIRVTLNGLLSLYCFRNVALIIILNDEQALLSGFKLIGFVKVTPRMDLMTRPELIRIRFFIYFRK